LAQLLAEHGVADKAARVYLAACRAGPQTASELARLSAVNRVEAYRFIKQLTADGLLLATGSRPGRFAALPPDRLIDRWIRRAAERAQRLEAERDRVLTEWREGRTEFDDGDPRRFAVLEGRSTIHRFLAKRLGMAESQVCVSAGGVVLSGFLDGGIDRALREAHGRGVKVRIATEIYPTNLGAAKHFLGFADLRHLVGPVLNHAVVIDRAGALVYVSGEDGPDGKGDGHVALWSTAPVFVQLARDNHRRLWSAGERAEARLVELETPPTAVLPVRAGREGEPFRRLTDIAKLGMRASGVAEFRLHLPELIEAIARQLGREMAKEVDGATPEQVGRSLAAYYAAHAQGRLAVIKERPLTLRVTDCFACTEDSPEIGRVMCPQLIRAVFESRLGYRWDVSKPDPTKHANHGCLFTATAA
jgi:sugar-specific transcriptional regulator TrmB/predicted hydrocarbon binding protein